MTTFNEEDFEDSEQENEDESPFVVMRGGKNGTDKDLTTQPVDNAKDVPLFSDADKRGIKSISYIEVIKVDQPNTGFKGRIPPSSTHQTIYELYGNGTYNLIACNHKNVKLREVMGMKLSIPEPESEKLDRKGIPSGQDDNLAVRTLIQSQHIRHEKDLDRTERLAMRAAEDSKLQSQTYVELVKTTTESAALRDREHMKGVNDSQTSFMQSMLAMMQQGFQQTFALQQAAHAQTMEILIASNKDKRDPMEMLLTGIKLAKDLGDGDETPPWLQAIDKGMSGLGHLVSLAKVQPMQIPGIPKEKELVPNTDSPTPKTKPKIKNPHNVKLTVSEAEKLLALKAKLDSKGIDFEEMITETLRADLQAAPELEDSEESEESEETTKDLGSNASNMDG